MAHVMRAAGTVATVLLVSPGLSPVPPAAPPPAAAAPRDWSMAPSGDGRGYVHLEGRPGAVLKDTLSVSNPGGRARTVLLRGTGAPAPWLAFAERALTVPPRTRADVPFTVTVPLETPPGDRSGAIVADGGGRTAAVRVRLRVTGTPLAALSVEDLKVVARAGGGASIHYTLVNRGNTVLRPRLAVRADGLFGEVLRRRARPLPVALPPGRRTGLTEDWAGAPGLDAVEVRLTVTAAGGARDTATTSYRAAPGWAVVSAAGALAVAAVGAGAAYVRRRGRSGART
ncbi:hypothetical protein ACQUSR_20555 [Streptomyces sp. P1-3]|uniref:COG1470 family protein n=1 Tax=Streptomyces sp. P1-3 TaxID=3421658 RepID=UPI003D35B60D